MKRSHIWISVIAVLVFGFLLFGDALARVAWEKHKFADLSLALNFSDAGLAFSIGSYYFVKGEYSEALLEINKELEANPENLRSLYVRGLINAYSENLPEAENDFRGFVSWAPKEWAGYNDLAWILAKQGKYKEAEEVLLKALYEIPGIKNPWLYNSLGVAQLNQKEFEKARVSFE